MCKAGFKSKEHLSLTSSFDYAGPMTETVLMGNLAIRSYMLRDKTKEFFARKKLLWDGDNMKLQIWKLLISSLQGSTDKDLKCKIYTKENPAFKQDFYILRIQIFL